LIAIAGAVAAIAMADQLAEQDVILMHPSRL
jgi:hypothetical protein